MKKYKILVRESNIVAYYVYGTSTENAQSNWAENGYDSDTQIVEDSECDILGCELVPEGDK